MSLGNLAVPSEGMSVLRDHSLSPGFLSQSLVLPLCTRVMVTILSLRVSSMIQIHKTGIPVDPEIRPADTKPKETDKCKTYKQGRLLWY